MLSAIKNKLFSKDFPVFTEVTFGKYLEKDVGMYQRMRPLLRQWDTLMPTLRFLKTYRMLLDIVPKKI